MAKIKGETLMAVLAGIAILYMIYNYSQTKKISGMTDSTLKGSELPGAEPVGMFSSNQGAVSNNNNNKESAEDLLPRDSNSNWQNNLGDGALKAMSLLNATDLIGMQGSVKRNMNLTIRCDPPIEKVNVGPFLQSTIEPVPLRCFEIGCDSQL